MCVRGECVRWCVCKGGVREVVCVRWRVCVC